MKTYGLRILDKKNRIVSVNLQDLFEEIFDGNLLYWSILFFSGDGSLKNGKSIMDFEEEVRNSEKGIFIKWDELNQLADCFYDVWDILIIGCKDVKLISRYKTDQEMYENCDIVIEKLDSSFWEVFSNDAGLIGRLSSKFKDIKFLESNFKK